MKYIAVSSCITKLTPLSNIPGAPPRTVAETACGSHGDSNRPWLKYSQRSSGVLALAHTSGYLRLGIWVVQRDPTENSLAGLGKRTRAGQLRRGPGVWRPAWVLGGVSSLKLWVALGGWKEKVGL